jgi:hypothetical protein
VNVQYEPKAGQTNKTQTHMHMYRSLFYQQPSYFY